jgi:hemerythrin-like domain-containing protein
MTCLQKHIDANHLTIYKRFQKEINNEGKENVERQYAKKRSLISNSSIFEFFASKDPFKNDDVE